MQSHKFVLCFLILFFLAPVPVARAQSDKRLRQQELRGSITPERSWWDLQHYELSLQVFPDSKSIKGSNRITFKTLTAGKKLQLDLQAPLSITQVRFGKNNLRFVREGNVYWISFPKTLQPKTEVQIDVFFSGKPTSSRNPPWSGGFSWKKDKRGAPFIATTCQGIGASIWWPNKDHGYDEPDRGITINATVPEQLVAVANGRLKKVASNKKNKTKTYQWVVTHPINNYAVNLNIGDYVNLVGKYQGEFGKLDVGYWVLRADTQKAKRQFIEAPRTLEALEYWFGKYPFYEDSYKLVQVPYLGMEHQSSVTYGNGFKNGYRGSDLSGTGVGLKFDFIIVHESAHEWFGNNISMKDAADMWIHESFASYAESLFVEYFFTRKEAADYIIGTRKNIRNNIPIIGKYGLNKQGSGDMYPKGANMLHTLRQIIDNDIIWRRILRGLNSKFWHKTVTTQQVEDYISAESGIELGKFFDQYLRTTKIPILRYRIQGKTLTYHFENVVAGFSVPVRVRVNHKTILLRPTKDRLTYRNQRLIKSFVLERHYYMETRSN